MARGTVVLLHGTLMGYGMMADCEVLARKATTDDSNGLLPRPYVFTDCSVIGTPTDLPDGEYTISFEGFCFTAICHHGQWSSHSHATKVGEQIQKLAPAS
jgi:hypothetical protein